MYGKILVGTDGSPAARRAAGHAARLASAIGGTVVVASVAVEHLPEYQPWSDQTTDNSIPIDVAAERAEGEAAWLADHGIDVEVRVLSGRASEALAKEAVTGGYDLLVIGERGLSAGMVPRPGSVCEELAQAVPCPLLIVP